jgi:4'-phosphopantetheinyl transferase
LSARTFSASEPGDPGAFVHLWLLHAARDVPGDAAPTWERWLSGGERARSDRLHDPAAARRARLGHALRRGVLSRYQPVEPADWDFDCHDRGKPFILSPASELSFSVSHSGDWLACAVTNAGPVGLDVEKPRDTDYLRLAARFFAPQEHQPLAELEGPALQQRFLQLWTLKEAALKHSGEGLTGGLDSCWFEIAGSGITPHPAGGGTVFHLWQLPEGASLALCGPAGAAPRLFRGLPPMFESPMELFPCGTSESPAGAA